LLIGFSFAGASWSSSDDPNVSFSIGMTDGEETATIGVANGKVSKLSDGVEPIVDCDGKVIVEDTGGFNEGNTMLLYITLRFLRIPLDHFFGAYL
jgi:hypothetical protein